MTTMIDKVDINRLRSSCMKWQKMRFSNTFFFMFAQETFCDIKVNFIELR